MELFSEDAIQRSLAKYFDNATIKSFKHLKQGVENTSIFVDIGHAQIVVRFWGDANHHAGVRNESDILGELGLMQLYTANGLPVPKIYTSLAGNIYERYADGSPYVVMDYAHGELPQDFTSDMVGQVGKVMGKMHLLAPGFNYPQERAWPGNVIKLADDRANLYLKNYGTSQGDEHEFTRKVITDFKAAAAKADLADLPQGAIQGDIMDENMKFENGKLTGIFDFDDYRYSFFLEDIVKTLFFKFENPSTCLFGKDGSNYAAFLESYESVRPLTPQEKTALPLFCFTRFVYNVVNYYKKVAEGKEEYRARIPASIERYQQFERYFKP
ncbi:MAG TPA: phosphotransferase [Candidatus Saccharimonadales bacterium]|nr:phosphotransferase [Candidatus Saccharimonadales bacterium]